MPSRREFMIVCGVLAAASSLPARLWARMLETSAGDVKKLADGVWVIASQATGGNSLLIATKDKPILIDTKLAQLGAALVAECRRTAGDPPALVINTHHHADHTGGNWAFAPAATIVAHSKLKPRLSGMIESRFRPAMLQHARTLETSGAADEANQWIQRAEKLTIDDFAADFEFENAHLMDHGGIDLHARHFGPGHTDNDIVVLLPKLNIVHMGDLVFHRWHPFIDLPGGADTRGWQNSLSEALKMCDEKTVVIPGHGAVGASSAIQRQVMYFDTLRSVVKKAIDEGKSRDEIGKLDPPEFKDFDDVRLRPVALQGMYDELTRH